MRPRRFPIQPAEIDRLDHKIFPVYIPPRVDIMDQESDLRKEFEVDQ